MKYSPRIHESLIPRLYRLSQEFRMPMTQVVREALEEYLASWEKLEEGAEEQRFMPVERR